MRNSQSARLAASAFAVAKEAKAVEEVMHSLDTVDSWIRGDARLRAFLQSKKITGDQKKEALKKALVESCHTIAVEIVALAAEERSVELIKQTCTVYRALAKSELGIVSVHAQVAETYSDSETASLKSRLDEILGKTSDLKVEVNPDLIGGIKLRVEDTYLDASLQSQLKRMRDTIVSS
ncbi:MAG: ATP synthase F1 subunit delta [Candidatus Marinimicrobia bacterium]|jgi:F-type H+-transporting ATPase subunit delta|nr:ATP synthase F1 subunit delta [Candidatus Neomarinimicrobiota bacterium]MDP6789549.1 ATP synthase F1 subunit delta [Candidatus Neomarinimicrobiota bacterium]MDP7071888.1 ATP synthase F1 subunit delta [Candidatus Neomarinimicrobiota bacterium]|tara:strand:- start:170 stop:706 length:537 start_codon:yes stop_codon:yes gene_type:complete